VLAYLGVEVVALRWASTVHKRGAESFSAFKPGASILTPETGGGPAAQAFDRHLAATEKGGLSDSLTRLKSS
ncbi:MAG: hypothetical protein ACJ78M_10990, partial [Gemmatimonadaceae bacterium]